MLRELDAALADFEQRYGGSDWQAPLQRVEPETYTYGERVFGLSFP